MYLKYFGLPVREDLSLSNLSLTKIYFAEFLENPRQGVSNALRVFFLRDCASFQHSHMAREADRYLNKGTNIIPEP